MLGWRELQVSCSNMVWNSHKIEHYITFMSCHDCMVKGEETDSLP